MDLREYNSALDLGCISIGNRLLNIRPFLTGNCMTHHTRCWKTSRMPEQCFCLCLEDFIEKEIHECSKQTRWVQFGVNHHSLDGSCDIIR